MGKGDFLTPKAIANRIKAKGLQKLRWYCQMCQKQCRDDNGFKCHIRSEGHQRQMALFNEKPGNFLDEYSRVFKREFLRLLSHRFNESRVAANIVYNEYIKDRHHVHMNATTWQTLTGFVQYMGREGICKVEDTPKGWFITYINRDPEAIARSKRKEKMDMDDADRASKLIKEQVQRGHEQEKHILESTGLSTTEAEKQFQEATGEGKVKLEIKLAGPKTHRSKVAIPAADAEEEEPPSTGLLSGSISLKPSNEKKRKTVDATLEDIMAEEERKKRRALHARYSEVAVKKSDAPWLRTGVIVKLLTKVSDGKFKGKKGEIVKVIDQYVAEVSLLDKSAKLRVDQEDLETVIPAVGGELVILSGPYEGKNCELVSLDIDHFCASVRLLDGKLAGETVHGVAYEDVCKRAVA